METGNSNNIHESRKIGRVASTLIVLSNVEILAFQFSDEISAYLKDNSIFDYLEYEYSDGENEQLNISNHFDELNFELRIKLLSDWFCEYLKPFSYNEVLYIIEYFGFCDSDSFIRSNETHNLKTLKCPVCEYGVYLEESAFEICSICSWQNDTSSLDQFSLMNTSSEGKVLNIKEAKKLFISTGNSEGRSPTSISVLVRDIHELIKLKQKGI